MSEKRKMWIWLLIPLLYGALSFALLRIVPPLVGHIVFLAFWVWVGMRFAQFNGSSLKNFAWGNSLWLVSFLLYLWQFVLVDDANRNMVIAFISQCYVIPFVVSGTQIYLLFNDGGIDLTNITIITYIFMLVVFMIGFVWGKVKQRS